MSIGGLFFLSVLHPGRREYVHRKLFLRVRRPGGALKNTAVCDLFAKRVRQCGLPVENYSAYSLRHAFAMRLLERGVGVKAIGDLLGQGQDRHRAGLGPRERRRAARRAGPAGGAVPILAQPLGSEGADNLK